MKTDDVERIRQQLEDELDAGIKLLREAYAHKVRALEVLAFSGAGVLGGAPVERKQGTLIRSTAKPSTFSEAVEQAVASLSGDITHMVVRERLKVVGTVDELGNVKNSQVTQALKRLVRKGQLSEVEKGRGTRPSVFRKTAEVDGGAT